MSIQLMPRSTARVIAAMESASSCGPQPNIQSPPPIAQAPKPMTVISRSELPSRRVCTKVAPVGIGIWYSYTITHAKAHRRRRHPAHHRGRPRARGPKTAQPGDAANDHRIAGGVGAGTAGQDWRGAGAGVSIAPHYAVRRVDWRARRRSSPSRSSSAPGSRRCFSAGSTRLWFGFATGALRSMRGQRNLRAARKPPPRDLAIRAEAVRLWRFLCGGFSHVRRLHDRVGFGNPVRERRRGRRREGAAPRHGGRAER